MSEVTTMKGKFRFLKALKIVVMIAVVLTVLGFIVMNLWNWLVPAVFTGPTVNYWEALGLLVLARLLFGGFRGHGHGHGPFGRSWQHSRARWKEMTPEEREQFRSRFRERWGRGCMPDKQGSNE
jgi:hypothetical protein